MELSQLLGLVDPWERQMARQYNQRPDYYVLTMPNNYFSAPAKKHTSGTSEVINTDEEFQIKMDVCHFKPEEIKISAKDNRIIIEGCHEEKQDEHGFITRKFKRQYVLPKDVEPTTVTSSLNANGVLTLKAPKKAIEPPKEIPIPIAMETNESGDGK